VEPDVTVSCEQAGDGCTWRAESARTSGQDAAESPHRERAADEPTTV